MKARPVAGGTVIADGQLTLFSGGTALFGAVDMGAVVPFVRWFNVLAGFAGWRVLVGVLSRCERLAR